MKAFAKFKKLIDERTIEVMLTILLLMPLSLTIAVMLSGVISIFAIGLSGDGIFQFILGFIYTLALTILLMIIWKD